MSATVLHAVFLRAINTGTRRITNDELLAPFQTAGFTDVAAFQAAGNIVFRTRDAVADGDGVGDGVLDLTEAAIESMLSEAYGFDTPVFMRSEPQLRSVVERCPFTDEQRAATAGKVQVTFMHTEPTTEQIADVAALTPDADLVAVDGREWFWLPEDGVSSSKLPVRAIEGVLGPMTMRTLGTVERLLQKFVT